MNLSDYLSNQGHGAATRLAKEIGGYSSDVSDWCTGARQVPLEHCVAIEQATKGQVTRKDLRPDDWERIWPELSEKEGV